MIKKILIVLSVFTLSLFFTTSSVANWNVTYSYPKMERFEDLEKLVPRLPYNELHPSSADDILVVASYTMLDPSDIRLLLYFDKNKFDLGEAENTKQAICKDLAISLGFFSYKNAQQPKASFRNSEDKKWAIYESQIILYK